MPGARAGSVDAAPRAAGRGLRGAGGAARDRAGEPVRALWLPKGLSAHASGGMACESQASGTDLETGRSESACEAAQTSTPVAERRLVHSTAAGVARPRVELRLRARAHARWTAAEAADLDGRVHTRVPVDRRGAAFGLGERAMPSGGALHRARRARAHPLGQRAGIHSAGGARLAGPSGCEDALHRAGQPVGERIHRELQRQAAGRTLERRNLLHTRRGARRDRSVAA